MKKKNLHQTHFLILSLMMMNLFAVAQDCGPAAVWTCYTSPPGTYCFCADTNSIWAQTCPPGQTLACRLNGRCLEECQCVDNNKLASWLKRSKDCDYHGNPHVHWRSLESDENIQPETLLEGVHPNPVFNSCTILFSLSQSQHVILQIFDMSGRLVSTLADEVFEKGENEFVWNATNINTGIYFVAMKSGDFVQTEKIVVAN